MTPLLEQPSLRQLSQMLLGRLSLHLQNPPGLAIGKGLSLELCKQSERLLVAEEGELTSEMPKNCETPKELLGGPRRPWYTSLSREVAHPTNEHQLD